MRYANRIALAATFVALSTCLCAAEKRELVVRHTHYFLVVNDSTDTPTVAVQSRGFFTYADGLTLEILDNTANARLETRLPVGAALTRAIPGPAAPYYLLVAKPGMNGVVLDVDRPWGIVAGGMGVGSNGYVPRMFLYVPGGCEELVVTCHATSPNEGGRITVLDPDGRAALAMDGEFDAAQTETVSVPAPARGKVWSFTWDRPKTVKANLDDIVVTLDGQLAPLLWPSELWAADHGPAVWQRHKAALAAAADR